MSRACLWVSRPTTKHKQKLININVKGKCHLSFWQFTLSPPLWLYFQIYFKKFSQKELGFFQPGFINFQ